MNSAVVESEIMHAALRTLKLHGVAFYINDLNAADLKARCPVMLGLLAQEPDFDASNATSGVWAMSSTLGPFSNFTTLLGTPRTPLTGERRLASYEKSLSGVL
jgi:hypothetical protein